MVEVTKNGVTARGVFTHCEDNFAYIEVTFRPTGVGARVRAQGFIRHKGSKGAKAVTSAVIFHDDGRVLGYGNTANGVRFEQKKFDQARPHGEKLDLVFI